jgi:tRNA A-37 threonylcarbamoyl transferase component Bud32
MEWGSSFAETAATPTSARRYLLLRRIAVGGMGELLLARSAAAGGVQKLVAIKRVRAEYASDPTFVSMFLNEARLAATIDHANVVRTYDLVEDAGTFLMVMEYLHGEPLGRLLNALAATGGRVPLGHVVTIVLGVAAGLHCAHERRGVDGRPLDIVHRDLSPGNVFITYEGGVKLLDFGIAKATSRTSITLGPARKGKVAYMSPEQCVGKDVDRRSDIFALGVVAWELCTGQRLFRGDNEFAIMNQVATADAPTATSAVPELPDELSEILARALRRDREGRFQTAMEMHDAIESFAKRQGILPSNPALGRYLEDTCGRREYPSVEPSEEFRGGPATVVVPGTAQRVRPRRFTLVLAIAGGALAGALGVVASSSGAPQGDAIATPPEAVASTESSVAAGLAAVAPPVPVAVPAPTPAPAAEPTPVAEAPEDERKPARARKTAKKRAKKPSSAAPKPATDSSLRGIDGLLPSE